MSYAPRISTFFGELGKGEAPYDIWKYEVDTLRSVGFLLSVVKLSH
jgi:hypothetical protein